MQDIAKQGSTSVSLDQGKAPPQTFNSFAYTKLGTCMPPSLDYGSVLAVSRFVAAYGLKGGNIRVVLTKGAATAMLNGHPNNIVDISIAPDPRPTGQSTVASLSGDGICRLWEVSNQDAGGELDTREILHLRTKPGGSAQRVIFHPAWSQGKTNNMVFLLHDGTVTGIAVTHEIREENAVDPSKGLLVDNHTNVRMVRDSKVLDMSFIMIPTSGNWRCVTAHEDGTCCIWPLGAAPEGGVDDDGSSVSMESAPLRKDSKSSSRRLSVLNLSPLLVFKAASTPVLTVGFITPYMLVTGAARNCEVCMWSLEKLEKPPTTPVQKVTITRSNPPIRSFRGAFVRRFVDGACTLALFESRTLDAMVFQLGEKRGITSALAFKVQYPVLSVSGDYDIDRDRLVCHVVDVDSIEDLDCPSELAFGSVTNMEIRNSMRRASKKAESLASKEEIDVPIEWNDKKACCTIC